MSWLRLHKRSAWICGLTLLLPLLVLRGGVPALRAHPRQLLMLGLPLTALPFMLLAYASLHITAGLVAVLNATAPLFAARDLGNDRHRLAQESPWGANLAIRTNVQREYLYNTALGRVGGNNVRGEELELFHRLICTPNFYNSNHAYRSHSICLHFVRVSDHW